MMLFPKRGLKSAVVGLGEVLLPDKVQVVDLGCEVKNHDQVVRLDRVLKVGKLPYIADYPN
jgi:hypothetical protein